MRAALRTANFAEYGALRFGFNQAAHQECLAAGYLGTFPRIQLRPLFFRTDFQGKHVVPALTHTASWIAEHHEDFRADLMECNPTTLLRSDITDLPVECKPLLDEQFLAPDKDLNVRGRLLQKSFHLRSLPERPFNGLVQKAVSRKGRRITCFSIPTSRQP